MRTKLALSHLEVIPGESARIDIEVTNTADIIDGIGAMVDGVDFYRLERPFISVFPSESETYGIVFDVPQRCPAGEYPVSIRLVSTLDTNRYDEVEFNLTVASRPEVAIELTPTIVTGGKKARLEAAIINKGNDRASVTVHAMEPTREVACSVSPSSFVVHHDDRMPVEVQMRGKRPWFGEPVQRSIVVTAIVEQEPIEKIGTFNQKARVPRGVITMLILAAIVTLWALIFYFVVNALRDEPPVKKAVATHFITGAPNIPLAAIAGTASGRVTAATTGDGLERITIEAVRVTKNGSTAVASVATNEDGEFLLPSLLPGSYKLKFSGDGFDDIWYPGTDEKGAELIPVVPTKNATEEELAKSAGLDIEFNGRGGEIVGTIELPRDSPTTELTVVITQIDAKVDTSGAADGAADQAAGGGDAAVVVAGGESGQSGGDTTGAAGDTTGAAGDTTGTAGDANAGDGGIDAASADPATCDGTVASPGPGLPPTGCLLTSDGTIAFANVPTPGTYRLTITGPGFDREEVVQRLDGGDQAILNTVRLLAETASISGRVIDQNSNGLGDVKVVARTGDTEITIVTPTSPAGSAGTFVLDNLETPQTYELTFTRDGFSSATKSVPVLIGQVSTVEAQLIGGEGSITGTARGLDGLPLGDITVDVQGDELSAETATLSASVDAGTYAVSGLPVPGRYTITFSGPRVHPETVAVDLTRTAPSAVADAALTSSLTEIRGTVFSVIDPTGADAVTITLSNGVVERPTVSATNPRGAYAFADVAAGSYTLTFTKPTLETRVVRIDVTDDSTILHNGQPVAIVNVTMLQDTSQLEALNRLTGAGV